MKHLLTSLIILVAVPAFAQDEGTLFKDTVYDWFEHDYAAVYNTPQHARYVLIGEESFSLVPDSIHLSVMSKDVWESYSAMLLKEGGTEVNDEHIEARDGRVVIVSSHSDKDTGGLIICTLFGSVE